MLMHLINKMIFKNGILKACDEICEKKNGKRNHKDTGLWNEKMKGVRLNGI